MTYDTARPIALDVWKDPQNFVITHHVRDEAWIYFRCWETAGVAAGHVGCLHFEGVWHIDSTRFSDTRGYPNVMETDLRSYYLLIEDSSLLKALETRRAGHDREWNKYDRRPYRHYVVESHDFYTNVIAGKVSFSIIGGERAKPFFEVWETV